MDDYNMFNGLPIPKGQRYESFILDPHIWGDSPKKRFAALQQYTDKRFHLPENFVDYYNKYILEDIPDKEAEFLTYVFSPRKLAFDEVNTEHTLKHMAAIWVLTGDIMTTQDYAIYESKYSKQGVLFQDDVAKFCEFLVNYKIENSSRDTHSNNPFYDISFEDWEEMLLEEEEGVAKKFPIYYKAYKQEKKILELETNGSQISIPFSQRMAELAKRKLQAFRDEILRLEEEGSFLEKKDYNAIRNILLSNRIDNEILSAYDLLVKDLQLGMESREHKRSYGPNPYGLFYNITKRIQSRSIS